MSFIKNNTKAIILFVVVFLISLLITICNFKFLINAGGDQSNFININILWELTKNTWDENTLFLLGGFSYADISSTSYILPFKLLSFLPNLWRQYIYFALFFSLTFLCSYYYFKNFLFNKIFPALISAIFYLFNLYLFSCYFNVPNQFLIVVLPLLLILCHCIIDGNLKKILLFSVLSSLFIPGAFVNIPNGLPLVLLILLYFIFLIIKENKYKEIKRIINYLIITLIVLLLLNSWWLLTMINSLFGHSLFEEMRSRTVEFFPTSSLHEAFRFLGGWSFNDYYNSPGAGLGKLFVKNPFFIFLSYFIIIVAFCTFINIKKEKSIGFFIFLAFLGISLSKGSLNPWGDIYLYAWKNIPLMYGFRTPHSKFMIIYLFPVCCLLGYFVNIVSKIYKKREVKIINVMLIFIIMIIGLPFIFGGFLNRIDGGASRSYLIKVPDYLWEYRKDDYLDKLDYRFMIFPEANGSKAYNWEKGFNTVFSKMDFFSEKSLIQNNQYRLDKGDELAIDTYKNINYFNELFNGQKEKTNPSKWKPALFLGILNVRYFIQENDLDWRYRPSNSVARSPSEMKKMYDLLEADNIITKKAEYGKFDQNYLAKIPDRVVDNWVDGSVLSEEQKIYLKDILYKELKDRPALDLYNINKDLYVPHIYIPEVNIITGESAVKFYDALELNDYSKSFGIFFTGKNQNKNIAINFIKELEEIGVNYLPKNIAVEYRRIGPTKYKVVLHNAKGILPLIFSDAFDLGWKLYLKNSISLKENRLSDTSADKFINEYKILEGNNNDQATKEDLADYISKGWISTLGKLKPISIKHFTFVQGAEKTDYIEKIKIDFVSKNYKRTIQNNNLDRGSFWETWFPKNGNFLVKRDNLYMIEEQYHVNTNGFANSWVLDINDLCMNKTLKGNCLDNKDGTYDLEMILEFEPQKIYYLSVIISGLTIICLGLYFLITSVKYHKKIFND